MEEKKTNIFDKIETMYNIVDENGKQKNKAFFYYAGLVPLRQLQLAEILPRCSKKSFHSLENKKIRKAAKYNDLCLEHYEWLSSATFQDFSVVED